MSPQSIHENSGKFNLEAVKQAANGKWAETITSLASIDPESLDGRHHPCPKCGGTDRFRAFDDFAETGGVFCNQCHNKGGGDGFATLMWLNGWLDKKLGIAANAIEAFGGEQVAFPKSGISSASCLAFYGRSLAKTASVKSVLLHRLDGLDFEPIGKLGKRKTHLVGGSQESWIWPGTIDGVAQMAPQRTTSEHEIILGTDEERVANEAIEALAARADIYQRGGCLAHIVYDATPSRGIDRPSNSPQIKTLPEARLRELMTTVADFVVVDEDEKKKTVHPPVWAIRAVAARGQWDGIRPIEAVVESPIMRPNGSILQTPGYDTATASFYAPRIDFPEVDDSPTKADAQRAAAELLDVVIDFPFDKPEHKSAWLASLLTPLCRLAFAGPSPLFAVDANVRGSGKSLLTDCVSATVSGRDFARMTAPKDDEEARKRITAIALAGEPLVLLDNIHGSLGSAALDAALTSTMWSDRRLGTNEMITMPLNVTWFASGNNISLEADTARRVCHIRLESPEERPEERSGFQHPDLLKMGQG